MFRQKRGRAHVAHEPRGLGPSPIADSPNKQPDALHETLPAGEVRATGPNPPSSGPLLPSVQPIWRETCVRRLHK